MTEGHPGFVANNGRIGFGVDDYAAYAPETGRRRAPGAGSPYVATRRSCRCRPAAPRSEHYRAELGADVAASTSRSGCATSAWTRPTTSTCRSTRGSGRNRLADHVRARRRPAGARAARRGRGRPPRRSSRSARSSTSSHPERSYVKVALSIQNMGFLRGLSPAYMARDAGDQRLGRRPGRRRRGAGRAAASRCCASTPRSAGPATPTTGSPVTSPYRKMVAALWRESPVPRLARGGAAGHDGLAAAPRPRRRAARRPSWSRASGARRRRRGSRPTSGPTCARSCTACSRHDLAFMPHGENLVMVLRDHVPTRMLMKDIGEEVAVLSDRPLPDGGRADPRRRHRPTCAALAIHTDVFDGFLRHLGGDPRRGRRAVRRTSSGRWSRDCIADHAADHPELAGAAATYDLLRAEFRTAASTGSSCATRSRWSTSPTRPSR